MSSQIMKNLDQSCCLNNFGTHCEFTKAIALELFKGTATTEQFEVLAKSMKGIEEFMNLIKERLEPFTPKEAPTA